MTVQQVVLLAAHYLGLGEQVNGYFNSTNLAAKPVADLLIKYFNIVENELALDYLPLYAEDVVSAPKGKVEFSALTRSAVKIISVKDENGKSVKYNLFTTYLIAEPGELTIRYTYTPAEKGEFASCEYTLFASNRMLAYGIVAQYYYASGMYDEGDIWHKKYRKAIAAAYRAKPARVIASRKWV